MHCKMYQITYPTMPLSRSPTRPLVNCAGKLDGTGNQHDITDGTGSQYAPMVIEDDAPSSQVELWLQAPNQP